MKLSEITPTENTARINWAKKLVKLLRRVDQNKVTPFFTEFNELLKLKGLSIHFLIRPELKYFDIKLQILITSIADTKVSVVDMMNAYHKLEKMI